MSGLPAASPSGQSRDQEITAFYSAYRLPIRRYLIACGCPEHEADDVLQETIVSIRGRWEHVRTLEKPVAYWYKAAGRLFRREQAIRARHYCPGNHEEQLLAVPDPANDTEAADRRTVLMAAMRELPPRLRQVFWLRLAAGFSEAETAEILSIRVGSVKRSLYDARARLKELLEKDSDTWDGNPGEHDRDPAGNEKGIHQGG